LLNLRIDAQIDEATFARKNTELRDRVARIKLLDRSHDETAELAVKVFELFQTLRQQWLAADYAASNHGNRGFELSARRRNSSPHNKKALRRTSRRARFRFKSG
jgi:hypothetical protein